jgi:hypothetical protein
MQKDSALAPDLKPLPDRDDRSTAQLFRSVKARVGGEDLLWSFLEQVDNALIVLNAACAWRHEAHVHTHLTPGAVRVVVELILPVLPSAPRSVELVSAEMPPRVSEVTR